LLSVHVRDSFFDPFVEIHRVGLEKVHRFSLNFKTVVKASFQSRECVEIKWIRLVLVLSLFNEDDESYLDDFEFVCWDPCLYIMRSYRKDLTLMYLS
jgi:hypothetical protein